MSAVSFLGSGSIDDLNQFQWDRLHRELSTEAPILLSILINATKTRVPRPNSHIIVGTCVSLLLKHRNPKMSLLQKMISIVLYAGHASKQTLRLLDKVGVNHDSKVVLWRESLISQMKSASEKTEVAQIVMSLVHQKNPAVPILILNLTVPTKLSPLLHLKKSTILQILLMNVSKRVLLNHPLQSMDPQIFSEQSLPHWTNPVILQK